MEFLKIFYFFNFKSELGNEKSFENNDDDNLKEILKPYEQIIEKNSQVNTINIKNLFFNFFKT